MSKTNDTDSVRTPGLLPTTLKHGLGAALLVLMLGAQAAAAQEDQEADEARAGAASALMEEVTVTARKRFESEQQVPLSISALSGEQIEALKVRTLQNLSVGMPNVAMDDIGTTRGVANFSIRGLGINSSIPGIDPTVGVFIDGVYLGLTAGVVIDMFDIESIEVLRGPQGTLFGRNVTGGAVLINTRRPTDEFAASFRAAVDGNPSGDGGLNYYVMGALSGPIGDTLSARLSVYHNEDDGWFENLFDGSDHYAASTTIVRPVVTWEPNDDLRMTLRWEHTESDGDGPPSQVHTNGLGIPGFFTNFERDTFDFAIDEPGFIDFEMDHVSFQTDWDVPFGDGTVTNIFGWREYFHDTLADIDAQAVWLFHATSINDYEQYSNELRYTGTFGGATVTAGLYWFESDLSYSEGRQLGGVATGGVAPFVTQDGGGLLDVESKAAFFTVDYEINDAWTINLGTRYTSEDKDAQIATLTLNTNLPCTVFFGTCPLDFISSDSWDAWSGKAGFTYAISGDRRLYGHWSRSHRSGGYNLRNTAVDTVNLGPGPFDQETVDTYEFGYKSELGGRGRLNAAIFYTTIEDMQRELNLADPIAGVVQIIRNTADAEILGAEIDATFALMRNTILTASVGYTDPAYDKVIFDLNGDGRISAADRQLELPRAAEWTYSLGLTQDWDFDNGGVLTGRVSYAFRDDSFYTDNNLGFLLSQEILDAGLAYTMPGGRWTVSLYGRNLLNDVNHGGDTQLPATLAGVLPWGGTFSPLIKGRTVGLEINFDY